MNGERIKIHRCHGGQFTSAGTAPCTGWMIDAPPSVAILVRAWHHDTQASAFAEVDRLLKVRAGREPKPAAS